MVSPQQKRAAVTHLMTSMALSERRACTIVGVHRSVIRKPPVEHTDADPNQALRTWLCAYARAHPRWGYRRAHADAVAEGWRVNHKKTQRLWREEGLRVPQPMRRKRRGDSTIPTEFKAQAPDEVWAIDFQSDSTDRPQPFRSVSLVDEHTRESLADHTAVSITGDDVVALLEATAAERGIYPLVLRADNGPEFICQVVAEWAADKVGLAFIPPGQPWRNGYVESFHARQRDECLNITVFGTVAEAAVVIKDWHWEYNNVRRHSALGYKTPTEYAAACTHRR